MISCFYYSVILISMAVRVAISGVVYIKAPFFSLSIAIDSSLMPFI